MTRKATVLAPDEGALFDAAGDRYRFLAFREDTDGAYGLWEAVVPPGGGPPPHLHTREEEGFYVVEGQVTISVHGQRVTARAGAFVNMPKGVPHAFRNEGDRDAKLLILVAPGGMERMLERIGTAVDDPAAPIRPFDEDEKHRLRAAAPEYGIELMPGDEPT